MRQTLRGLWHAYLAVLRTVCAALLVGVVVVTLINVTMRYVLGQSIVWADEVARLGFIIFSFLGAALAVATNAHLAIDTIVERLGSRGKRIAGAFINLVAVGFFLLLLVGGVEQSLNNLGQGSPALRIPLGYIYAAVPFSAVLMLMNLLGAAVFPPEEAGPSPSDDVELKDPL